MSSLIVVALVSTTIVLAQAPDAKGQAKKENKKEVKAAKAQQKIVVDPQSEVAKEEATTKGKSEAAKTNAAAKKQVKAATQEAK